MFQQVKLPYSLDALEPYLSSDTLNFHYNDHYKGYVDKLNELLEKAPSTGTITGTPLANASLEEIIRNTNGELFNMASQVYAHEFLWKSMSPNTDVQPSDLTHQLIKDNFSDLASFKKSIVDAGAQFFGSGWLWIVCNKKHINIEVYSNAESPLVEDKVPLLTCDLWEHAYYLDYKNERKKYLESFTEKIMNWDFLNERIDDLVNKLNT